LKAHVTAADTSDRDGARALLRRLDWRRFPRVRHGWVDQGYRGEFLDWVKRRFGVSLEVVARRDGGRPPRWVPPGVEPPAVPAFAVVPRRWVVQRTFGWLGRLRRLSKDYEFLPATLEALIYLAMSQLLLRRLARSRYVDEVSGLVAALVSHRMPALLAAATHGPARRLR
jgi:transposase